jgi:hypothetical protein
LGGKHTSIDNLKKGVKIHLRGDVSGIAEEMILNPQKKAEIDRIIKEVLSDGPEVK